MSACSVSQVGDREWWCETHKRNAQECEQLPLDEAIMPKVDMIVQSAYRAGWARSLDELLAELQRDEVAGVPISLQRIIAATATVHDRGKTATLVLDGTP